MINLRLDRSAIAAAALFRGLSSEELDEVAASAHTRRFAKGALLFEEGDPAGALFVVLGGHVKIFQEAADGRHIVLGYADPGDFVGTTALVGGTGRSRYPAAAVALQDVVAVVWNADAITRMLERFPKIAINALGTLGERIDTLRTLVREMSTERLERRLAHALLRLVRQAGRKAEGGTEIDFPLTRQDLAEAIGATLHSVSRVLSAWEVDGLVEGGRCRIVIRQPHRLMALAEDVPEQPRARNVDAV